MFCGKQISLYSVGCCFNGRSHKLKTMDWKANILTSDEAIKSLLVSTKTIAVLGIKPETHANQPAHYVPKYMADAGFEIIPVPVYYPEVTQILRHVVHRNLADVPAEIDLLNVFRRSADIPKHTAEILATKPKAVWFQLGIRNDEVAETMAREGIKVVQDLCLMVEHRALIGNGSF
jgi:predicted CoA-binding protein